MSETNSIASSALFQFQNRSVREPSAREAGSGGKGIDRGSELYAQCQEFESIFVKMMLKTMRDSVQKSGLVDGGMAEDVFKDMLYDEYALSMSRNASFGIADQIYLQLNSVPASAAAYEAGSAG